MLNRLSRRFSYAFVVLVICSAFSPFQTARAAERVFRVDGLDGSINGDGSGWGPDAFLYLQDALAEAADWVSAPGQDNSAQIWVRGAMGAGIKYRPDQSAVTPNGCLCPTATFTLVPRVRLYGGFDITHTQIEQRQPYLYITVLSGELELTNIRRLITATNPAITLANTLVDGFIIRDAKSSEFGGAVYCAQGASPWFNNCRFVANSAWRGGAVYVTGSETAPAFTRCHFIENTAASQDVQLQARGGGLAVENDAHASIVNCTFAGNTATGLSTAPGIEAAGGAISISQASVAIINSLIANNGVGAGETRVGSGIYNANSQVEIINCTIVDNVASVAGGGYFETAFVWPSDVTTHVANSIFWGNTASSNPQMRLSSLHPGSVLHSNIQGGIAGIGGGSSTIFENNIDADPLFETPTLVGEYRLSYLSPCLNGGNASLLPADEFDLNGNGNTMETIPFDLDNKSRQINSLNCVDMGAYENQVPGTPNCPEDITGADQAPDSAVGVDDLLMVITMWGTPGGIADLSPAPCGDGDVGVRDLLAIISAWGPCDDPHELPESISGCFNIYCAGLSGTEWQACIDRCVAAVCSANPEECE